MDTEYNRKFDDQISKLGDHAFFEQAYQSRKFLCDKDTLDTKIPENAREFFYYGENYGKYSWQDVLNDYSSFETHHSQGLQFDNLIQLLCTIDLAKDNIINYLSPVQINYAQKIIKMQNFFIAETLKRGNASEEIINYFRKNSITFPEEADIIQMFHRFFLVSCKYGLYIPRLIIPVSIDSALEYFYTTISTGSGISLCPTERCHPRYKDFLPVSMNKEKADFFSHKTTAKRAFDVDLFSKNKATPAHRSFLKMAKGVFDGPYRTQSIHMRLVGLWLWDRIDNPRTAEKLLFPKACKLLKSKFEAFNKQCPENQDIYLRRSYYNTKKCVESGEVLAFKDKYVNTNSG